MTYGWAILIMLAVISVLFFLGVFNPRTVAPNACVLTAGFSCFGYRLSSGDTVDGALILDLSQGTGHSLRIDELACTAADTPSTFSTISTEIFNGEHKQICTPCFRADGSSFPDPDEFYRGRLFVRYTDLDTNIAHQIVGDIAYRVETQDGCPSGWSPCPGSPGCAAEN